MICEYESHTADVLMRVSGLNMPGLFENCLRGMNNILKNGFCDTIDQYDLNISINIMSIDTTSLLIDFLSEALSQTYVQKSIFCKVNFKMLTARQLQAQIFGKRFDTLEEEIKAVTYHGADIYKNGSGHWETKVIFDI